MAIAAGDMPYSLALKADGTVAGWGDNRGGQATPPAGLSNVVAIAAGGASSLALNADGGLVAWGSDWNTNYYSLPSDLTNVIAIAIGSLHGLALKADGGLVTWGENWGDQTNVPVELRNVVAIAAGESHSLALIGYGPPLTAVPLENPAWDTGGFRFSIPTQSGRVYALEYKDLLTKDTE